MDKVSAETTSETPRGRGKTRSSRSKDRVPVDNLIDSLSGLREGKKFQGLGQPKGDRVVGMSPRRRVRSPSRGKGGSSPYASDLEEVEIPPESSRAQFVQELDLQLLAGNGTAGTRRRKRRLSLDSRISLRQERGRGSAMSASSEIDAMVLAEQEGKERGSGKGGRAEGSAAAAADSTGKHSKRGTLMRSQTLSSDSFSDSDSWDADVSARKSGRGKVKEEEEDVDRLVVEYGMLGRQGIDWNIKRRLLRAEEEKRLAYLLWPGKELLRIKDRLTSELGREPSRGEWASACQLSVSEVEREMRVHQAASNKLIMHNLRLVLSAAHKYKSLAPSATVQDLAHLGLRGLLEGVNRFDPSKGFRFSTYTTLSIRTAVLRGIGTKGSIVRVPAHVGAASISIRRAQRELQDQLSLVRSSTPSPSSAPSSRDNTSSAPSSLHQESTEADAPKVDFSTPDEAVATTSSSTMSSSALLRRSRGFDSSPSHSAVAARAGMSLDKYKTTIRLLQRQALSLHATCRVSGNEMAEMVPNEEAVGWNGQSGNDRGRDDLLRYAIDDVLDSLKPRESIVLRQRFGLDGKGERTLGEVGSNLNVSREMARKYEMKALTKIRHPQREEHLRPHLLPL